MARSLDVYLHERLVGRLIQNDHGQTLFQYEEAWLQHPSPVPLSQSLPLRPEPFDSNECRGFFGGILPEEAQRTAIARNLGVSANNDFALLELIGGECAGAITFIPSDEPLPAQQHDYRALSPQELAKALRELPQRPLLAGEEGIRLSLAGAQSKLAVYVSDAGIGVPLGGAPSTHILKPATTHFQGLIENEALCLRLARTIGLNVANAELGRVEDVDYLLIERYDRRRADAQDNPATIERLHQEDLCQALGIQSIQKYQNEGGPSLKQSFDLIRRISSAPVLDLRALLDAVIFNYLIGNHDAHGKNFSILYSRSAHDVVQTRLAPLYDLVCTAAYEQLSTKMAMKIGGEYESAKTLPRHFDRLAEEVGFAKKFAVGRVPTMADAILKALPGLIADFPGASSIRNLLEERSERAFRIFSQDSA